MKSCCWPRSRSGRVTKRPGCSGTTEASVDLIDPPAHAGNDKFIVETVVDEYKESAGNRGEHGCLFNGFRDVSRIMCTTVGDRFRGKPSTSADRGGRSTETVEACWCADLIDFIYFVIKRDTPATWYARVTQSFGLHVYTLQINTYNIHRLIPLLFRFLLCT